MIASESSYYFEQTMTDISDDQKTEQSEGRPHVVAGKSALEAQAAATNTQPNTELQNQLISFQGDMTDESATKTL